MGLITDLPALEAEQIKAIAEALFEGFFGDNAPSGVYQTETGIKAKKQIIIFGKHTGLSGFDRGDDCDTTANSTWTIPSSEKLWDPFYIGDRFGECYGTYMDTFIKWGLKKGVNKDDLTGTELAAFISEHMEDMIKDVILRHAYFGNAGIVAGTNNNLGAGDLKFFNVFDGFFEQLFDIVGADANRLSSTDLTTKNAEAAFADQKFNDTDTTNQVATKALDQMYYDADMRLRMADKSKLVYKVTQSVYDQLERERKATGGGAIYEVFLRQENGTPGLRVNGIEVVAMPFWDRMIQTHFVNGVGGTAWVLPHRAVLTTRDNFVIGTEDTSSLGQTKVWHSDDDEKMYMKYGFMLDAKIALDNLVQAAY